MTETVAAYLPSARMTSERVALGIRRGWLRDRECRRRGHRFGGMGHSAVQIGREWWPICGRCGRGVRSVWDDIAKEPWTE